MSHPVLWPKKTFFYPIGNTAPVCLTQDLAPEEPANILLLGCGDPRSILYTLYATTTTPNTRTLDFTCCDIEPAILARNVLLFTLMFDDHPIPLVWNIFYHFKIDQASLSLLIRQCERLLAVSYDLDSWLNCPYSPFLRVCSRRTLQQLRDHWQLYSRIRKLSKQKNKSIIAAFDREFESRYKNEGDFINITASRSAGPFWSEASKALSTNFAQYWRTGTIFHDTADIATATSLNPTFIYSLTGEGCAVHYATYPLQSFHLASAFSSGSTSHSPRIVTDDDLRVCAQLQFQQWCHAFKAAVSAGTVTIRLFAGDALAFCKTLYHYRITSSPSASLSPSAWTLTELILDGGGYDMNSVSGAPTTFNIIDTSNIMDHVGLLNVLVAVVPLLFHGSSSTLYTEALLTKGKDATTSFFKRLCAGIPDISLLFGIAPMAYLSNFSSYSNVHEVMLTQLFKSPQCQERVAWKIPYLGDDIALRECGEKTIYTSSAPLPLARLLFDIYYHMFSDEDIFKTASSLTLPDSVIHYHRGTFASLLGLIKSRVQTDWISAMEHLFDLLHADRKLIMGSNNYQELCCQLYMRGIYCVETLGPRREFLGTDWSKSVFREWTAVPPIVCLIITIPRDKIKVLEDMSPEQIGSPMLQCDIRGSTFHNIFSSIQVAFGTISILGSGDSARASLNEDLTRWSGSSPLIVSVWVPSFNLAIDPLATRVGLGVHSTPVTARFLSKKLGPLLNLFTVNVNNRDSVHIVSTRPNFPEELPSLKTSKSYSPTDSSLRVVVELDSATVSKLSVTSKIENVKPGAEAQSEQSSPYVMRVTIGQQTRNMVFPFPVDGKRSKLRIARQSGWIEVCHLRTVNATPLKLLQAIVPVAKPCTSGGLTTASFPLLLSQNGLPTVWNVHRVNMEQLPVIDVSHAENVSWIGPHVALSMSDSERTAREQEVSSSNSRPVDVLSQVKESLRGIFVHAIEHPAKRVFGLKAPRGGVFTIIFINCLRLDLASHTLVADTCILPLTNKIVESLGQYIANMGSNEPMVQIQTPEGEMRAWKHLLAIFAERCRNWSHKQTCQYVKTGSAPLSVQLDQNPLCGCGEGIQLGGFAEVARWKKLVPFVTRAAISPLFAPSMKDFDSFRSSIDIQKAQICAHCKAPSQQRKLLRCSRCKVTSYCGQVCQNADWKKHKVQCKAKQ